MMDFMDCVLTDYRGNMFRLPVLIGWELSHGTGKPCDAFEVSFVYEADMLSSLRDAIRFHAFFSGETVFYGVVDEFEILSSDKGRIATVRGRGLQALLLDNEAEAAEYYGASVDFIVGRHVTPWGINSVRMKSMSVPGLFSVASGSSQWSVLSEFARFGGGVRPRFTRDGVLLLNNEKGDKITLPPETPVSRAKYIEKRHGIISAALVKNKAAGISTTVDNKEFIERGGLCRRVVLMPRRSYYDAQRHTGEYQIEMSREGAAVCTLTLPKLFAAFAGDIAALDNKQLGLSGEFEVNASRCYADGRGYGTELTLWGV